jgi:hypothetical protein
MRYAEGMITSSTTQPKKNTLAIVALVLSSLFFVPVIPLVGLVLSIVALVTGRNRAIAITGIAIGAVFTVVGTIFFAGMVAGSVAYTRRAKSVEAAAGVGRIADAIAALPARQWAALSESDWTPSEGACGHPGGRYPADASPWVASPWPQLDFAFREPHYYQFRLRRYDQGFVVEAQGDLDCDGVRSHFQRRVTADGVGPLQIDHEQE